MERRKKTDDTIQLENLMNLITATISTPSRENIHLLAHGLNSALNRCIKHLGKEPAANPPPVCPKCSSTEMRAHGKTGILFYCPKCFKTFPGPVAPQLCPDCTPESRLAEVATAKVRYSCKHCKTTYIEGAGTPTDFNKFIYFSHLIYNTDLSYSEIICKLKISSDTYYRWKKRLAIYFPNTWGYLYGKRGKK